MTLRLLAVVLSMLFALPVPSVRAQTLKERTTAEFAISVPSDWVQRPLNISLFAPVIAANREIFAGMGANAVGRLLESLNSFIAEDPMAPASVAVNRAPLGIDEEVARLERSPEVHTTSRRRMILPVGPALEYKWTTAITMPSGQRVTFAYTDYYLQSPWQATYVLHFGSVTDRGDADAPLFDRIAASFRWTKPERFAVLGFSILAPGGEGWLPLKRAPDQIQFLKVFARRGAEPHTVSVLASARDIRPFTFATPADLLAAVKSDLEPGESRLRNAVSSAESSTTPAPLCVRYRVVMEDLGVPGFVGAVFITTRFGLRCVHPEVPWLVMDVVCSQRALRGREQLDVDAEIARLFDSVVFTRADP
jgi:hypothetical protein